MDQLPATLALLKPDDLWPAWRMIDAMEKTGSMSPEEARRWKEGIYRLMERWGLEPGDLMGSDGY